MAPGKPVRLIKVHVPRLNSTVVGPKLKPVIEAEARTRKVNLHLSEAPSDALAQAIESASEWNSYLMTARAERGPQWDVGTQLFHVDQDSDLYYDFTVLAESAKKKLEEENGEEPQTQHQQQHQQQPMPMPMHTPHREPHRPDFSDMRHHDTPPPRAMSHGPSPMNMGGYGGGPYAGGSPMTRGGPPGPYPGNPGAGGIPFNSPSGPYFNGPQHHDNSPMRMGMGNMNMGGPGPMDFQGHGGGMGIPPGMGSSMGNMGGMGPGPGMGGGMPGVMGPPGAMMAPGMPDMRRRVTRGMSEEGYMMH